MIPDELRAELAKHEAALDAFCWASTRLLFAGGAIFCALVAIVRNNGDLVGATRDSIARDMTASIGVVDTFGPTVRQLTGVDFTGLRNTLVRIRTWATTGAASPSSNGGFMPIDRFSTDVVGDFVKPSAVVIARRGSFVGAIDRARNIVPVPSRDIDADDNPISDTVPSVADYASALSRAAKETEQAGVVDMQRLVRIQCECEIMALNKFTEWLRGQVSPMALANKKTASPRAYLAAVQGNRTPAPWSGDVVQDIINDPTKTYGTIDVGERLPVDDGAGEPPSSGAGLGIAAAVLIGLAALR